MYDSRLRPAVAVAVTGLLLLAASRSVPTVLRIGPTAGPQAAGARLSLSF